MMRWFRCSRCATVIHCNVSFTTNPLLRHVDIRCPGLPDAVRAAARAVVARQRRASRHRRNDQGQRQPEQPQQIQLQQQQQQQQLHEVLVLGAPQQHQQGELVVQVKVQVDEPQLEPQEPQLEPQEPPIDHNLAEVDEPQPDPLLGDNIPLTMDELSEQYSRLLTLGSLYGQTLPPADIRDILRRPHNW